MLKGTATLHKTDFSIQKSLLLQLQEQLSNCVGKNDLAKVNILVLENQSTH